MNKKYKTIVISDVHLGSKWSKCKEATIFLKKNSCETLILCGDIIDGWAINRSKKRKWRRRHSNFVKVLLEISHNTKIIYVRGNHDDFLDRVMPINFLNIEVVKDYVYNSNGRRYYVLHGDVFDKVTSSLSWLAKIGDVGYSLLLWMNSVYNRSRVKNGLPYYSISREIKNRVKGAVNYISDFEEHIVSIAKSRSCDGVICGHIHHPEIKEFNGVKYLNSGDWIESLSALTEDFNGNWTIFLHQQNKVV